MYSTNPTSMSHGIQSGHPTDNQCTCKQEARLLNSAKFTLSPMSDGVAACGLNSVLVKRTSNWDTKDEELLLKLFLMYFGNDWAQYRQFFPTRTVDSIKSKFHNLVRATHRKRSKIHCKSHQNIVIMVRRAQELMKDDVKRGQSDAKQKVHSPISPHAMSKHTSFEITHKEPHLASTFLDPLKTLSPTKIQLNELPPYPIQFLYPPLLPACPLLEQGELPNSSPLLLPSYNRPVHSNISQCHSPVEASVISKDSPMESTGTPLLYMENGCLFSFPINYFGFITLPFVFSELGGSIPSVIHPSHQHREERKSPESSSATVGPVKLEEGSYLNALCKQCGSIQTLRIRRAGDILAFSSVYKGDSGEPSAPTPLSSIHSIVCVCPVCTTSAELIKEAGKYVWKLRYSAAPQTSLESSISTAACPTSGADQLGSAVSQGHVSRTHVSCCDDGPLFYQNFEVDSIDCFSTLAHSSNTHLRIGTPLGGFDTCSSSHPDSTIWSSTSVPTEHLSSSISNQAPELSLKKSNAYSTCSSSQLEAGPISTDDLSISFPLQYQEDLLFNAGAD
ncbi:Hypothetical protein GLP15_2227 [Giardia lamblia P15]|uniref:Myb-like domain-containing protein n=1 Tax=Giardia intestinalis (strain P15) TaxID=658858 RepID=E1F760_GIAIA|nr:Hypothetical protein GLP15_2227 [Giardia lamblia P15]